MGAFALGSLPLLLLGQLGVGLLRSVLSPRKERSLQRGLLAVSTVLVVARAAMLASGTGCH
jgi:hypothetical protein